MFGNTIRSSTTSPELLDLADKGDRMEVIVCFKVSS